MVTFTCKDCKQRYSGCHDICEKYRQEKARYEADKAQKKLDNELYSYARSSAASNMDAIAMKRKKQHGYHNFANQK